jgi:hypothetical protein
MLQSNNPNYLFVARCRARARASASHLPSGDGPAVILVLLHALARHSPFPGLPCGRERESRHMVLP